MLYLQKCNVWCFCFIDGITSKQPWFYLRDSLVMFYWFSCESQSFNVSSHSRYNFNPQHRKTKHILKVCDYMVRMWYILDLYSHPMSNRSMMLILHGAPLTSYIACYLHLRLPPFVSSISLLNSWTSCLDQQFWCVLVAACADGDPVESFSHFAKQRITLFGGLQIRSSESGRTAPTPVTWRFFYFVF